jgi:hypothetical protein
VTHYAEGATRRVHTMPKRHDGISIGIMPEGRIGHHATRAPESRGIRWATGPIIGGVQARLARFCARHSEAYGAGTYALRMPRVRCAINAACDVT